MSILCITLFAKVECETYILLRSSFFSSSTKGAEDFCTFPLADQDLEFNLGISLDYSAITRFRFVIFSVNCYSLEERTYVHHIAAGFAFPLHLY